MACLQLTGAPPMIRESSSYVDGMGAGFLGFFDVAGVKGRYQLETGPDNEILIRTRW